MNLGKIRMWLFKVGHFGFNLSLDVVDLRTGEIVWFPGISKWRREVNHNV